MVKLIHKINVQISFTNVKYFSTFTLRSEFKLPYAFTGSKEVEA
jgi:hypothetical protein